ncbi:PREDICTED: laccase-12-like isoform X1 [Nicotiana attenuata]|uniref:Laccase n=1 Tax=Nicotiana attenuata TaxID=49451 RepID=A0A1J6J8V9_NICAT|nr:PREDICTED: laccase-12-like isoform X1 [Nicotiana attenuata]OIT03641.1 laccase-12 [Nicotiana attenuata]
MANPLCYFSFISILLLFANAKTQYHDFVIQATPVKRLCKTHNTITVNGQFPGPTLEVNNGDTLVINVVNRARYNVTIHWHGVKQIRTAWADGPEFITQCPIRPGGSYTYRFTIQEQEGTLWWHAHSSWLRATVYGALIIHPKEGEFYPFPKPRRETPILLGEWWDANPIDVIRQATRTGAAPNVSDAYTINGQPGDLYRCSSKDTTIVLVDSGETSLLRVINAALNQQLFFTVANHKLTVVGADASYVQPFTTSVLMLGPGQTTDVLITGNQPPARYYMAARAYASAQGAPFDNTTTTAILEYKNTPCAVQGIKINPVFPSLPQFNDTATAAAFTTSFRSPSKVEVPTEIDENLFITVGLGLKNCPRGASSSSCQGPNGTRFAASMNNVSFVLPPNFSILQAHQQGIPGIFSTDFPAVPPVKFDYTGNVIQSLWQPVPGTKVYKLKYGAKVQVVLQGTSIVTGENHPIHLHGYDFYIIAEGFGNFNPQTDTAKFNLVDPPRRNTASLPVNGWSVIRFVADNPGVWLMHCHLDVHITWGLAMSFLVENGVNELESLEDPPVDLPVC